MSGETQNQSNSSHRAMRVAVEGCGHGTLDAIYASIQKSCEIKGWDGVDLVIIGGDFQAVRDRRDLNVTAMPAKYRNMADFHQYYWGKRTAPFLTIFIGGNHEASNHLFELYYGGWVAPNIYYLGAANVIQAGPLKIAGMSGIWKGYDYRKPHYERLPYSHDDMYSIYHVRELDVRKLLSFRSQVDIGMSHDWPKGIEWLGDHNQLFKHKPHLQEDAESGRLGNTAAQKVMDRLRPTHWFSAHLHTKYAAIKLYQNEVVDAVNGTVISQHTTSNQTHRLPFHSSPHESQLSAWNNFGTNVREKEAAETARLNQEGQARRNEAEQSGVSMAANYIIEETYKKVKLDGGIGRDVASVSTEERRDDSQKENLPIPQLDGCCASLPLKRRREASSSPVRNEHHGVRYTAINNGVVDGPTITPSLEAAAVNPDAIDIEMSDDDDERMPLTTNNQTATNMSVPISKVDERGNSRLAEDESVASAVSTTEKSNTATNEVSEETRAQLMALSSKFEAPLQVSPALPQPETITNQTTKFLALSKAEDRQNFLQLLEIESYTSPQAPIARPVTLRYEPEWLAILRVFAPELKLNGGANDPVPQHRGDTYYRERIIEEEKWIQEHVVEKDLLDIPSDFTRDMAVYDSAPADDSQDLPREATNHQTSAFCKLIGINNIFDISEEERNARMTAGPSENIASNSRGRGEHGHKGGRGGGRGGGHENRSGRGRGNRGWGGRGRGRN